MGTYFDTFYNSFGGAGNYLWKLMSHFMLNGRISGFYLLIIFSLLVWGLELWFPWRKNQKIFRKDFWQDGFYMFFNFYFFNLLLYAALTNVVYRGMVDVLKPLGYKGGHLIDLSGIQWFLQLVIFFFIADFVQWLIHNLLHRVPILWKFHKVHHSVKEMGFSAHLRYHFLETFVYQTIKYISLSMIFGFHLENAYYPYAFTVIIGHLNHANLGWDYGPLKYFFNNPKMHIWHHSKELPKSHPKGMNFGISLSCWDYIFGTSHVPKDGRDIELGFPNDENYPETFVGQVIKPFQKEEES
ncbi:MAG: sterol desaturase family protein [Crocinitomicaceae bacterium]|nr:sterol desaturase family protein [Crocinitomicaceae bacterium]